MYRLSGASVLSSAEPTILRTGHVAIVGHEWSLRGWL